MSFFGGVTHDSENNTDCYTDDWKRTEPDHVVYLPKTENGSDGYADHFVVAVTPGGLCWPCGLSLPQKAPETAESSSRAVLTVENPGQAPDCWPAPKTEEASPPCSDFR